MRNIVEDIREIVKTIQCDGLPSYMAGHLVEVNTRLKEEDLKEDGKFKKFPLVILRLDTDEKVENGLIHYNLNMAFVKDLTREEEDQKLTGEERINQVIMPILVPLYEEFIKALFISRFSWSGRDRRQPPHRRVLRPYWGTGVKNMLSDPLEGIEILDLKISQEDKEC